jgi:hypothetical protein
MVKLKQSYDYWVGGVRHIGIFFFLGPSSTQSWWEMVWTETEELLLYCFIPTNSVSSGRRNSIAIQSLGFLVTLCLWFLFSPAPECVETRQRAVLQRISFYEEEDINYSLLKLQRLIVLPHSWYLIKIYVGNHFLIYNCYSILSIINRCPHNRYWVLD